MAIRANIGLDLGSISIKLVKLVKNGKISVVTAASAPLTPGVLFSQRETDQETVATVIKKLFAENKIDISEVAVALPETHVFTRVIDLPQLSDEELASSIKWQAEQYIPLPLAEVNLDYAIISRSGDPKEKMQVLLVAAPLKIINWQTETLELAGLTAKALETQITAAARVFSTAGRVNGSLLVDLGALTTDIAVLHKGTLIFTHSINMGGQAITRLIGEAFNLPPAQAEEYKKAYGLETRHLEGKVEKAVKPAIDMIVTQIKRAQTYYQEKYADSIKILILHGGQALMPGLVPFLAQSLEFEVQVANPWEQFTIETLVKSYQAEACLYTIATGLALRGWL